MNLSVSSDFSLNTVQGHVSKELLMGSTQMLSTRDQNNRIVEVVERVKKVGVRLQKNLSFLDHILGWFKIKKWRQVTCSLPGEIRSLYIDVKPLIPLLKEAFPNYTLDLSHFFDGDTQSVTLNMIRTFVGLARK